MHEPHIGLSRGDHSLLPGILSWPYASERAHRFSISLYFTHCRSTLWKRVCYTLSPFLWSGNFFNELNTNNNNTRTGDANVVNGGETSIFERAQTLIHCSGRFVSAQLCSQPTCGSDPLSGLICHTESPGDSDSFPMNAIYSSQTAMSSLQTYLLHPAGGR